MYYYLEIQTIFESYLVGNYCIAHSGTSCFHQRRNWWGAGGKCPS